MALVPSGLYSQYFQYADALISEVNPSYLTLFYKPTVLTAIPAATSFVPGESSALNPLRLGDRFGANVPIQAQSNRIQESTTGYLQEVEISETIKVRAYSNNKPYDEEGKRLGVAQTDNIVKVICYASGIQKLTDAVRAEMDGKPLTLIQPPIKYGLGTEKRYCISYWKEIRNP